MFILRQLDGPTIFYLNVGKHYTIGRRSCDFILPSDNTVSKKHANITVTPTNHVYVEDCKSSNKTYINGSSINPNENIELNVGSEVKFGVKTSIFILQRYDEITITSSGLNSERRTQLKSIIDQLNGSVMMDWNEKCSHVVVDSIVLTVKVLCALIKKQYIVTPNFFDAYLQSIQKHKELPKERDYAPDLEHELLNLKIDFDVDRTLLFKNKTFVFPNQASQKKTNQIITLAGGIAIICDENVISRKRLLSSGKEYVFIQTNEDSQNEGTYFNKCIHILMKNNKRSVPIQEIAMAVLHCDCTQHCNPSFNKTKHLFAGDQMDINAEVMVEETQTQSQNVKPPSIDGSHIIPQTFEIHDGPVINNDEVIVIDDNDECDNSNTTSIKREGEKLESLNVKKCKQGSPPHLLSVSKTLSKHKTVKPASSDLIVEIDQLELHSSTQKEENVSGKRKSDDILFKLTKIPKTRGTTSTDIATPKYGLFSFKRPSSSKQSDDNPFIKIATKMPPTVNEDSKEMSTIKIEKNRMLLNPFAKKPESTKFLSSTKNNINDNFNDTSTSLLSSTRIEPTKPANNFQNESVISTIQSSTKIVYNSKWFSKSDIADLTSSLKIEDMDDSTKHYISGFKSMVKVVNEESLIKRKPLGDVQKNGTTLNTTSMNFKTFVKVQPLHMQKIIISRAKFKTVLCSLRRPIDSDSSDSENEIEQMETFRSSISQATKTKRTTAATKTNKKFEFNL